MRRRTTGWAIALAALVLGLVLTIRPGDPALYPVRPGQAPQPVFLVDNGFHADLALPRSALVGTAAEAARALPPGPWVLVGWGDASFFRAAGFSPARAADGLRALFMPGNGSVIRMSALSAPPNRLYGADGLTVIALSPRGMDGLIARLNRAYAVKAGRPVLTSRTFTAEPDFFYVGTEHFSIAKMCNQWASQLLGAAGAPGHRVIDGLVGGLLLDLRLRAGVHPHTPINSPVQAGAADLPAGG